MFVAELDRPWMDTPFLLQGFLVEDEKELSRLRRYCQFVFVDHQRSAAGLFPGVEEQESLRAAAAPMRKINVSSADSASASGAAEESVDAQASTRAPSPEQQYGVLQVSESGRFRVGKLRVSDSGRFEVEFGAGAHGGRAAASSPAGVSLPGFFGSVLEVLRDVFGRRDGSRRSAFGAAKSDRRLDDAEGPPRRPVRHDFIPASIPTTYHAETRAIEEEIVPARQAYARVEELTRQVVDDIRRGKLVAIDQLEEVIRDVVDSMVRSPDALMWVARMKKQDTAIYGHSLQVAVYLVALGRHLGLPKEHLARLGMLGLLLDVGKTKLPRTLLAKPRPLTADEFELIQQHVRVGLQLLRGTPNLHPEILEGIAQHHERENGSGYPAGLRAGGISLFGRMAGIADTFVALTNVRPHAEGVSAYEALRKLTTWSGSLFHAPLVEQFIQSVGVFPVGSLVELSSGEIAVVVRQSKVRRLKPRVLVICGPDKVASPSPAMLDLLYQPAGGQPVHIVRGLPTGAYGLDSREYYLS